MSRKHFILLAAALRALRGHHPDAATDDAIRAVAVVCAATNKEFSFDRFYSASNYKGLNDGKTNSKGTATQDLAGIGGA